MLRFRTIRKTKNANTVTTIPPITPPTIDPTGVEERTCAAGKAAVDDGKVSRLEKNAEEMLEKKDAGTQATDEDVNVEAEVVVEATVLLMANVLLLASTLEVFLRSNV